MTSWTIAVGAQVATVGVVVEESAQHVGGAFEVAHALEERGDSQASPRSAGFEIVEPGLAREQQRREHVGGMRRHRHDAGLHRLAAEQVGDPPGGLEAAHRFVGGEPRAGREPVAVQLAGEHRLAFIEREIEVIATVGRDVEFTHDLGRRVVEAARVVAQVERREVEAERVRAVEQRLHGDLRAGHGGVAAQAFDHRLEVRDVLLDASVGRAVGLLCAADGGDLAGQQRQRACVDQRMILGQRRAQAGVHEAQLLAVELVAGAVREVVVHGGHQLGVASQAGLQRRRGDDPAA